jgi:hypothetical protein
MSIDVNVQNDLVIVTESSEDITVNVSNAAGPAGVGVPVGGSTGQVLKKQSGTDYDTFWALDGVGVPYSGATGDVNLGEYGLSAGQITLDTTPTGIPTEQGAMYWDADAETVALIMNGTIQKIGEDMFYHVRNTTGSTIPKGTAVRFSGTTGNSGRLLIAPMLANGTYPSQYYMGITSEELLNNEDGKVYHFGKMRGINTSAFTDGAILYVSPSVAGALTATPPVAPNNIIIAAAVVHAANNGTLMIRTTLGSNINSDEGVLITTPANNEALIYESSTSLWKNKTIATALGYTPISGSGVTGQVAYWNGTNSQTGSNNLFWDAANARLGIGTNTPTSSLHVIGDLNIRGSGSTSSSFGITLIKSNGTSTFAIRNDGFGILNGNLLLTTALPYLQLTPTSWGSFYMQSGVNIAANGAGDYTNFQNPSSKGFAFTQGGTANLLITPTSNVLINSTTDGGQRLQVQGTTLLNGLSSINGAGIANTALAIYANGTGAGNSIFQGLDSSSVQRISFSASGNFLITGATDTGTSSNDSKFRLNYNFAPTSGTRTHDSITLSTTINQTGGANGITRGLLISPTLTAAADWRSIEWSNNSGWGLYGDGSANNFLRGGLGIGTTSALSFVNINLARRIGGASSAWSFYNQGTIQSDVTNTAYYFSTEAITQATAFTVSNIFHYNAQQFAFGSGSSVTNQFGYAVNSTLIGATNNYGFYGNIPNGTNRWNLYMNGTADNYLRGKLLINTTTVGTFDLDVNGTARVQSDMLVRGSGTTSASTGFTVQNSSSTQLFSVRNDSAIFIGNGNNLFYAYSTSITSPNPAGAFLALSYGANGVSSSGYGLFIRNYNVTNREYTSGDGGAVRISEGYAPTSGTGTFASLVFTPVINQTGGANGITRGLYIVPTLTAAADWRAIEVSAGVSVLAPSTTASATLRIPSGTAPTSPVNGDIWFDGTDLKMRIGGVTKTFTLI